MSFDPYMPYGPVTDATLRIVTWNVWGRYGEDWSARQSGIEEALAAVAPDVVCLVEAWRQGSTTQPELIAGRLGFEHHLFTGDWEQEDWVSGVGLVSRWPMEVVEQRPLDGEAAGFGSALHVLVDGERGPIQLFVAMLDYPLDGSKLRQAQVRQLATFVQEVTRRRYPTVVCGDFNAPPDSDEIRMLTGRAASPVPGLVFYDAWEVAGDGSPGYTWSNDNPLAAVGLYPNRRFDYILSTWPRLGGIGHPVNCFLLGRRDSDQSQLSDHYGVGADLRY